MARQHDVEYLRGREQIERDLAATATDPRVAEIHHELADGYAKLAVGSEWPKQDHPSAPAKWAYRGH